ncbi:MAG: EMC3/TMCO1 family protein [Candidatus Aenigmatarchaeota archaeon]
MVMLEQFSTIIENLVDRYAIIIIFLVSFLTSFITTIIYKFSIDQSKAKDIKTNIKVLSEKAKEKQKSGDKEELNKILQEIMKLNSEFTRMTFKPMIISLFPALIFLFLLKSICNGKEFFLPVSLPYIGSSSSWLLIYIIFSIVFTIFTRRLMKLEL